MNLKPGRWMTGLFVLVLIGGFAWLIGDANRAPQSRERGARFQYNLDALQAVPESLRIATETTGVPLPFRESRGFALDDAGRLFVAGDNRVALLGADGTPIESVACQGPRCVAVSTEHVVYIGLRDRLAVWRPGSKDVRVGDSLGEDSVLTSIAVSETAVFAADAGQRVVHAFTLEGRRSATLAEKREETGFPGLRVPSPHLDVAIDTFGALWVVDPGRHRLLSLADDGSVRTSWQRVGMTVDGFSGCCNPTDFAIMPDGSFITSEKGLVRVKRYRPDGEFDGVIAGPDAFRDGTVGLDLAVAPNGDVLVLDPKINRIRRFALKEE
jgi:hypothetical protein